MPEALAPGVYIEEVPFRSRTIEGVSTSTAGFVDPAGGTAELIEALRALLRRRASAVRDGSHRDVENALCSRRGGIVVPPRGNGRRVAVVIGAVALAAIVGIMLWRSWAGGPRSKGRRAEHVTSDSAPEGAVMGDPEVSDFSPIP